MDFLNTLNIFFSGVDYFYGPLINSDLLLLLFLFFLLIIQVMTKEVKINLEFLSTHVNVNINTHDLRSALKILAQNANFYFLEFHFPFSFDC